MRHWIPTAPGLVEQFKPRLKYLLIDENAYTEHELASVKNLVAAIFRFEHPVNPETINELLGSLNVWLTDSKKCRVRLLTICIGLIH